MLGVVPNGLIGFIWMVGTDDLKKLVVFLRNSKDVLMFLKVNTKFYITIDKEINFILTGLSGWVSPS